MKRLECRCRLAYPGGFTVDAAFRSDHAVTALFGPSGSGKTSILEAVAGLRRPAEGAIRLGDRDLFDSERSVDLPPERRRVGAVFQDILLFPHLTVEGNLRYGLRRRRRDGAGDFRRVTDVLELGPLLARRPRTLSGGERQRVALGRALLSAPDLLLLDEPMAALDESLKGRILAYVERAVAEWRIPLLFVSHSPADVRRLAEWVVVLDQGRVVGAGPPEEALGEPAALGWHGAAGPMNLLRIEEVRTDEGHLVGRIGRQFLRLPPAPEPLPSPLFVRFPPSAVLLSRHDVADVSARNHLQGVVRQVVALPEGVFVAVDLGPILWAVVTPEAARDLELEPGTPVMCLIKTFSLELVS